MGGSLSDMHQPIIGAFVAELASVHTQSIAAIDIDTAAAVAHAIAKTNGYRVVGVYSRAAYEIIQAEKEKGKTVGPNSAA